MSRNRDELAMRVCDLRCVIWIRHCREFEIFMWSKDAATGAIANVEKVCVGLG